MHSLILTLSHLDIFMASNPQTAKSIFTITLNSVFLYSANSQNMSSQSTLQESLFNTIIQIFNNTYSQNIQINIFLSVELCEFALIPNLLCPYIFLTQWVR